MGGEVFGFYFKRVESHWRALSRGETGSDSFPQDRSGPLEAAEEAQACG